MIRRMKRLVPAMGVMDTDNPGEIAKVVEIPAPAMSTINNWLGEGT